MVPFAELWLYVLGITQTRRTTPVLVVDNNGLAFGPPLRLCSEGLNCLHLSTVGPYTAHVHVELLTMDEASRLLSRDGWSKSTSLRGKRARYGELNVYRSQLADYLIVRPSLWPDWFAHRLLKLDKEQMYLSCIPMAWRHVPDRVNDAIDRFIGFYCNSNAIADVKSEPNAER